MHTCSDAFSSQNTPQTVAALNMSSNVAAARNVIRMALETAKRPFVSTKFGPQSAALLHLVTEQVPDIPVVWIDTGYNTRATVDYAQNLTRDMGLNLKIYRPRTPWTGWIPAPGEDGHAEFTDHVKLEPFARALEDLRPDVWFSSLRREQTDHRASQNHFNLSESRVVKVLPLIYWTDREVDRFIAATGLATEARYSDPTKAAANLECGLHLAF